MLMSDKNDMYSPIYTAKLKKLMLIILSCFVFIIVRQTLQILQFYICCIMVISNDNNNNNN